MDYGKVLSKAWNTVWKHKILWVFGILAGCGRQVSTNSGGQGSNFGVEGGTSSNFQFTSPLFQRWGITEETIVLFVFGLFCVLLVLSIVFTILSTVGRTALIKGTVQVEEGAASLSFGQLWRDSLPYFWRVLGLTILVWIIFFISIIVLVFGGLLITVFTLGLGLLCLLPLICILIPVIAMIRIIVEQATIALVVEDLGIGEAIGRGWDVVRGNIGDYIVMGLILVIGGAIVGLIFAFPLMLALAPIFAGILSSGAFQSDSFLLGGIGIAVFCIVLYMPVLIVLGGILQAYIESAWTLTFLEKTRGLSDDEPIDLLDEESEQAEEDKEKDTVTSDEDEEEIPPSI